jgi:phage terminase large subunit-like protein
MIISHWDIAYTDNDTSDYNAVRVWGLHGRNFWLIACYVRQSKMKPAVGWNCDYKKNLPHIANYLAQYESQFWNGEVQRTIEEVEDENDIDMNLIKVDTPRTNKVQRMIKTLKPLYQNGRIYYNEALKSNSDTQIGIMQLVAVEEGSGEHDDAPDADEQAISKLDKYCTPDGRRNKQGEKSHRTGKMKRRYNIP